MKLEVPESFITTHGTKNWIYCKFHFIKGEAKCTNSFDPNINARQMCVKYVMALPIHLIFDKEEGKCDLQFDAHKARRSKIPRLCIALISYVKGEVSYCATLYFCLF